MGQVQHITAHMLHSLALYVLYCTVLHPDVWHTLLYLPALFSGLQRTCCIPVGYPQARQAVQPRLGQSLGIQHQQSHEHSHLHSMAQHDTATDGRAEHSTAARWV